MPTSNNRRKSVCVSRPLIMKKEKKITFAQLKLNPPERNPPEKKSHWNKQHFDPRYQSHVLPSDPLLTLFRGKMQHLPVSF